MDQARLFREIDYQSERKSSFYASLVSLSVFSLFGAAMLTALMSRPEMIVGVMARPEASRPEVRESLQVEIRRVPLHLLLSEVRVPESPVLPVAPLEPDKPEPASVPLVLQEPAPPQKAKGEPARREEPARRTPPVKTQTPAAQASVEQPAAIGPSAPAIQAPVVDESNILAELLREVEARKHYPKQARRIGAEGVVTLSVSIDSRGRVKGYKLVSPSGNVILDKAAEQLAGKLVGLELKSARDAGGVTIFLPVRYILM